MSTVIEFIAEDTLTVDRILKALLSYEEIIGVLAVNVEGLVMGSAGIAESDIDMVSLLGASLVGVAERSTRRLGTGSAIGMTLLTNDGMITLRNGGDFALLVFSTLCDHRLLHDAMIEPMSHIRQILNPE